MDKGILSLKIMLLGAVVFLVGCMFIDRNSALPLLSILVGPVIMLAGLLMGTRNKTRKDETP